HVARNLGNKRLLLLGTYRDIEVDRTHPLSSSLADLRRLPNFNRVLLRGLNADEVRRMLAGIAGEQVPWSLAEAVHRQTEGNPLFVQEVIRYLAEEGVFVRDKGRWQAKSDTPVEMRIPDGLRDVIGKRLSSLSETCNKVLSVAAIIGRDFRLEVLQKVAGLSEEEIFKALEEARKAAVIEERTGAGAVVNYRFTHAFFRQTLYEEIIAPRRIRLHQQVARALEEVYKNRLEEHAAELAEHFSYSSDSADLSKAVSYGEMAAKKAISVYAYSEAVKLLDQAIKVQEILDPDDKVKRCDLLLDLGDGLLLAGEPRRVLDNELPEAFSIAETLFDNERALNVSLIALKAFSFLSGGTSVTFSSEEGQRWVERADRYALPNTIGRALANASMGCLKIANRDNVVGISLLNEALDLSRSLGDNETYWLISYWWLLYSLVPQMVEKRLQIAEEIYRYSRNGVKANTVALGLFLTGFTFLEHGQRQRAEKCFRDYKILTERTGQVNLHLGAMAIDALLSYINGDLDGAIRIADNILVQGEELNNSQLAMSFAHFTGIRPWMYQGMYDEMLKVINRESYGLRALRHANRGRMNRATQMINEMINFRPSIGTPGDYSGYLWDVCFLEAAVLVGHKKASELLLIQLAGKSPKTSGYAFITCIPRHMGGAAALLERYEEARQHYQEAIRICTEMRFRPELALSRLQLAELLLEQYPQEKSEAMTHLDFAIAEFRDMKMQPSLERALRHKEILKA
ncbi:MAG: hypothetical protein AB1585_11255, partial [Thermodesulfobacteriota bacterium]